MRIADGPPLSVKGVLASLGVRPSKKRGQSFLLRPETAERIADLAGLSKQDAVLEIGPGLGALTSALAARAGRVVALESDRRLAEWLRQRFRGCSGIEVVEGDALAADLPGILREMGEGRAKVVSNIPYSISGPLIARLMECAGMCGVLVLTVQRELARRIVAGPGGKEYGAFTVLCRYRAETEEAFTIAPGAFYPRPEVVSSVVVFRPRPFPGIPPGGEEAVLSIVRRLFSQRRKSIGAVLARALRGKTAAASIAAACRSAGVEPSSRPERLGAGEFIRLYAALRALPGSDLYSLLCKDDMK